MAAGIAHEIRNPLASMSGSIQMLRQELTLNEEQAQLMDIVLRESERLNETIKTFLAYARPHRFSTTTLDLRRVISDAALLLKHSSESSDRHQVDVDLPAEPVWFDADENQIRQIVWNLATNGLRAMPEGGRLCLSVRQAVQQDVVLSVTDEGVGIPTEELDHVLQPFHGGFQKGTGLGLAIVHRIVHDYGGEIEITSEEGVGTTVTIRFPLRQTVSEAAKPSYAASAV
jgi:two-component system sensor histidine kinase PilS (NtrC family)